MCVTITDDLRQRTQCLLSAAKARKVTGMVRRNFRRLDCQDLLLIYKTYIRPHLEYCIQSWSPYLRKKDIQCLEGVQRAITKLVPALRKLDYRQRLQKLRLTTLETRRRRDDLIETFKIMTGKEKVSGEQFFHFSTIGYQTRGHSLKIAKQRTYRLDLRKHFFSQRVVNEWNSLPQHVKGFDSEHVQELTGQVLARYEQ